MNQKVDTCCQTADGINPNNVLYKTLCTGATIPAIGLGTFGSDAVSHDTVAAAVVEAAALGYRHFDCASVYGNESRLGAYLVHWPFPNYHAPGCNVRSRSPDCP